MVPLSDAWRSFRRGSFPSRWVRQDSQGSRNGSARQFGDFRFIWILVGVLALLLCFFGADAQAQSGAGSISGTVKDPSGGVVPDATVTVTNTATGVSQTTQSNARGLLRVPDPCRGTSIRSMFRRAGFKPYKRTGLTIDVNTKLQVDIRLQLGEQSRASDGAGTSGGASGDSKHANGRRHHRPGDDGRWAERKELHRSAGASARHRADVDADGGFGRDGRRHGGDPAFRRPQSRKPID